MDAVKVMDTETDLYINTPNYENHMTIKEKEALQMIPERPKSFKIETEDVNNDLEDYSVLDNYTNIMPSCETTSNEGDKSEYLNNYMEDYLALDTYINIMPSCESTSNEGDKSKYLNNDMENYLALDTYINILPTCETASNESDKSPINDTFNLKGKKSARIETEMEAAVSAQSIPINILPTHNIYEGHREQNNEHTVHKKITFQNTPLSYSNKLKDKDEEQNTFPMWSLKKMAEPHIYNNETETGIDAVGVSICEQIELSPISNGGLIKSNSMTSLPCIYERVAETGINITDDSISDQPEFPETANVDVIRSKGRCKLKLIGAFLTAMVVMMAVTGLSYMAYYFTPNNTDNTRVNVTVGTDDGHVATNEGVCFNFGANCNTSLIQNNMIANTIAREDLIRAVEIGNITQVCYLLKCGAFVNSHPFHNQTLLHVAARNGHVNITQLLLTYKASIDKADSDGHTPLYVATQEGHLNVVQLLLANNALVDESDTYGWTPLHVAAHGNRGVIVELLSTAGANINAQTFRFRDFRNGLNPAGSTALHIATKIGHVNIVQFLLANNAFVDTLNSYGWTPLHSPVYNGRYVIVELLCNAGVDVNAKSTKYYDEIAIMGSTALHISVFIGNKRIVKTLLTYNASVNTSTKYGCTPLHEAVDGDRGDSYAIVELLCKAGADVNAKVERFRSSYASNGSTALHIAAFNGNVNILQLVLNTYNASLNQSDIYGWTPLHTAVFRDKEASVELLCNAGVDVNAKTHQLYKGRLWSPSRLIVIADGSTAIDIAVKIKNKRIKKRLMFHKTELLKDNNNLTALEISRKPKHI